MNGLTSISPTSVTSYCQCGHDRGVHTAANSECTLCAGVCKFASDNNMTPDAAHGPTGGKGAAPGFVSANDGVTYFQGPVPSGPGRPNNGQRAG